MGSSSGQVRVVPFNDQKDHLQRVYKTTAGTIRRIKFNQIAGIYLVVTNQLKSFSIFTDALIDVVTITSGTEEIIQEFISSKFNILIASTNTQLIIFDLATKTTLSLDKAKIPLINGFYLDESTGELFVYGTSLISTNIAFSSFLYSTDSTSAAKTL